MTKKTEPIAHGVSLVTLVRNRSGKPTYYIRINGKDFAARNTAGQRIKTRAEAFLRAQTIADEIANGNTTPLAQGVSLEDWRDKYLKAMAYPTNADSTVRTKKETLGWFIAWLNAKGVTQLRDVTRDLVADWHDERKTKVSKVTMRRDAAYVKHAFNFAVEKDWIAQSPARRLKTKKPDQRIVKVTDEATTLAIIEALEKTEPETAAAWQFLAETGVRPSEMWNLQPDALNLDDCSARFVQRKTGKVKTVYFTPMMAAKIRGLLRRKRPEDAPSNVFLAPDSRVWDRHSLRWHVYRWGAVEAKVMKMEGKRIPAGVNPPRPYLNRHTKATKLLVDLKGDPRTVADLLGVTMAMLEVYSHSNEVRRQELARQSLKGTNEVQTETSTTKGPRS